MNKPNRVESNAAYMPHWSEFAWFCGIFEGEGCISFHRQSRRITLIVTSTDEDVVRRIQAVMEGRIYGPYERQARLSPDPKPMWRWHLHGIPAFALLQTMLPQLSERRRDKALSALADVMEADINRPLPAVKGARGRYVPRVMA